GHVDQHLGDIFQAATGRLRGPLQIGKGQASLLLDASRINAAVRPHRSVHRKQHFPLGFDGPGKRLLQGWQSDVDNLFHHLLRVGVTGKDAKSACVASPKRVLGRAWSRMTSKWLRAGISMGGRYRTSNASSA